MSPAFPSWSWAIPPAISAALALFTTALAAMKRKQKHGDAS